MLGATVFGLEWSLHVVVECGFRAERVDEFWPTALRFSFGSCDPRIVLLEGGQVGHAMAARGLIAIPAASGKRYHASCDRNEPLHDQGR